MDIYAIVKIMTSGEVFIVDNLMGTKEFIEKQFESFTKHNIAKNVENNKEIMNYLEDLYSYAKNNQERQYYSERISHVKKQDHEKLDDQFKICKIGQLEPIN